MPNDKQQMLSMLRAVFQRWENLLAGMRADQISAPRAPDNLFIKDEIAHLWAWQQRSIARMEAALQNREPQLPPWPTLPDPEAEGVLDQTNAWIFETHRDTPWATVQQMWCSGFLQLLALSEAVGEEDLLAPGGKYPWLEGYPLSAVLLGSLNRTAKVMQ